MSLKETKEEFEKIKQQLIIENRLLDEDNDIIFYHDTNLSKLEDNQVLTYKNIGESLFPIMDKIVQYIDEIKNSNYLVIDNASINAKMEARNRDIKYIDNSEVLQKDLSIYQLDGYKNNIDYILNIDNIRINIQASCFNKTKNQNITIETGIYVVDFLNNIINKVTNDTPFSIDNPFIFIIPYVRFKNKIDKSDTCDIQVNYTMDIFYSDLTQITKNRNIVGNSDYVFPVDIDLMEIGFFDIINLFGGLFAFSDYNSNKQNISDNSYLSSDNIKQKIKKLYQNETFFNIGNLMDIVVFKGNSMNISLYNIRFDLYKKISSKAKIYFPSITPLVYQVQGVIDEL